MPELPPRTRRIQHAGRRHQRGRGTTSAHAENTLACGVGVDGVWNYLRARGEYFTTKACHMIASELPPRTRRIQCEFVQLPRVFGTTSAHAENTTAQMGFLPVRRNYLRARGEYSTGAAR